MTQEVISILLLGGQSNRMGQSKAELIWQGEPLWYHIYRLLVQISGGIEQVFISGAKDHPQAIRDYLPGRGPLMGFYSVLKCLRGSQKLFYHTLHPTILVTPVDLPLVELADFEELLNCSDQACIWGDNPLPAAFRYSENLFLKLEEIINSSDRPHSFQYLLKQLAVGKKNLSLNRSYRIQGTNTPLEWETANEFENKSRSIEISTDFR
jgi:molybdopterin-guanine dinucleotide biosynthesis protein A